jgi:tetratricopeptide (TPR) repeat protein
LCDSTPKDLIRAKGLVNESKLTEAYQVLTEFGNDKKIPLGHRVSGLLLQSRILIFQGKYNEFSKLAEQTYKASLGLEKDLRTVKALSLWALSLILLGEFSKGIEMGQQAENLLTTFPNKTTPKYFLVKALIAQNKGYYYIGSYKNIDEGLKYLEESLSLRKRYGSKTEIAMGFFGVGNALSNFKGELEKAIEYLKQGLTYANESGNKWPVLMILLVLGDSYFHKGELDRAIEYS